MTDCNSNCQCYRQSTTPLPNKKPEPFDPKIIDTPMTISEGQKFQNDHDMKFHLDIMNAPKEMQVEHIIFHIAKILGILSDQAEKLQHGEKASGTDATSVRIADLQIMTYKLATLWNLDVERLWKVRLQEVEVRQKL